VLYRPESHEPLVDTPWREDAVRAGIRAIVADAESEYDPEMLWPADEWDAWEAKLPLTGLYCGAAGIVWALHALREHAEVRLDLASAAQRVLEAWRADPDYGESELMPLPHERDAGLWDGETGSLLVAYLLSPAPELEDALLARVRENARNETNELMWGAPGTMLAARALHERTGHERWQGAWRESADELRRRRDEDGLWTQRLYGQEFRSFGPAHGAAGNAFALGEPGPTATAVARAAVVENGLANWPANAGDDLVSADGEIRVQWCHGAPGIVATLADALDEDLLLKGAELVWQAGPPRKGPMLCHGTAGNGFALLKTLRRTGDELWLERARQFAMHALAQVEALPPRYSLFTGGVGVAVYLAACIDADARFPTLERWD
jgi:hypothetical protein